MQSSGQHLHSYFTTTVRYPAHTVGLAPEMPGPGRIICKGWAEGQLCSYRLPLRSRKACAGETWGEHRQSIWAARGWGVGYLGLGVWETWEQADSESMGPWAQGERGSDPAQCSGPRSGRADLAYPHSTDRETEALRAHTVDGRQAALWGCSPAPRW